MDSDAAWRRYRVWLLRQRLAGNEPEDYDKMRRLYREYGEEMARDIAERPSVSYWFPFPSEDP